MACTVVGMTPTAKRCKDCEASFQPRRPNAKYCSICRVVRDLLYIAGRRASCYACDEMYAPMVRRDIVCGKCDNPAASAPTGTCGFCAQRGDTAPKKLLSNDVGVCLPCSKDPEQRQLLLKALLAKQAERRSARAAA